jgi:hypothetical protein
MESASVTSLHLPDERSYGHSRSPYVAFPILAARCAQRPSTFAFRTGFKSMIGVPSRASRLRTWIRAWSIAHTVTWCSPIGFGRCGERVRNTPSSIRDASPRGCTLSTSRRARSSHVNSRSSSPSRIVRSASANSSLKINYALGAPSSGCRGADAISVSDDETMPSARITKSVTNAAQPRQDQLCRETCSHREVRTSKGHSRSTE